jgi:hypothetical protein
MRLCKKRQKQRLSLTEVCTTENLDNTKPVQVQLPSISQDLVRSKSTEMNKMTTSKVNRLEIIKQKDIEANECLRSSSGQGLLKT